MMYIDELYYNTKRGIRNLIRWFPVVWKDRNWDHSYIYDVLRFKLNNTEHCIRNGSHISAGKDADRIKICVNLLDRLRNDVYFDMIYGDWDGGGSLSDINNRTKEEREDFNRRYKHEDYMIKQDIDMLFDIMKKNIQKWWE